MKLARDGIWDPVSGTWLLSQETDPVWGDGGVGTGTKALPAAYSQDSTFEFYAPAVDQVFAHVHNVVLGGGGLTGITCLLSFEDPDLPGFWIPSHEPEMGVGGVEAPLRTDPLTPNQEWACVGLGNFIIASRREHGHFNRLRIQLRRTAGAPDASTRIYVYVQTR